MSALEGADEMNPTERAEYLAETYADAILRLFRGGQMRYNSKNGGKPMLRMEIALLLGNL